MNYKQRSGDRIFLGMQDFDFAQIISNLPKFNHFCPNFASILLKFHLNFAQIIFARWYGCISWIPSSYGTDHKNWLNSLHKEMNAWKTIIDSFTLLCDFKQTFRVSHLLGTGSLTLFDHLKKKIFNGKKCCNFPSKTSSKNIPFYEILKTVSSSQLFFLPRIGYHLGHFVLFGLDCASTYRKLCYVDHHRCKSRELG